MKWSTPFGTCPDETLCDCFNFLFCRIVTRLFSSSSHFSYSSWNVHFRKRCPLCCPLLVISVESMCRKDTNILEALSSVILFLFAVTVYFNTACLCLRLACFKHILLREAYLGFVFFFQFQLIFVDWRGVKWNISC